MSSDVEAWTCALSPYSPVILSLERVARDSGLSLTPEARIKKRRAPRAYQADLLRKALTLHGPQVIDRLGQSMALLDGHPLVLGLGASSDFDDMFQRWVRFEAALRPNTRFEVRQDGPTSLELRHQGPEPLSYDAERLFVATVTGFIETYGVSTIRYRDTLDGAGERRWDIRWTPASSTILPRPEAPWGMTSDSARSVFGVLLEGARQTLARTARLVGVSSRTLQRQLEDHGTSFSEVLCMARVTLAARALSARAESITDVALASGYADGPHLSREFRHLVGVTPLAFRRAFTSPAAAHVSTFGSDARYGVTKMTV